MPKKRLKRKKFWDRLLIKNRLIILNENTFEEIFSFKLNIMSVFVSLTLGAIFLISVTTILIAFTPLREFIPGYSSSELKQMFISRLNNISWKVQNDAVFESDFDDKILFKNQGGSIEKLTFNVKISHIKRFFCEKECERRTVNRKDVMGGLKLMREDSPVEQTSHLSMYM